MLFKIFEMLSYDGIQYLDQSNVSQFTQKLPGRDSRQGQLIWFWRKLIFKILWHNWAQYVDKSIVSQFSKKNLLLEQYGPNLAQNYTTCIKCSRDF